MKQAGVVILILLSIHFWGYVGINPSLYSLTNLLALGIMGISMVRTLGTPNLRFSSFIFLYLFGIILNILSAKINNGQSLRDTTFSFFNYYFIIFYFYLHDKKISRKDLEVIILVFAVLYSIFYLWQEEVFPRRLFHGSIYSNRGTLRIRIEGNGFLMLAYFMLLTKFLLQRKIWQIVLAVIFFVILLKGGFRTLTAGAILLSGLTLLIMVKYSPVNYLMIVIVTVLFIGVLQLPGYSYIINSMINTTEEQQEQGDEYIRHQQYEYFTEAYPKNSSYYIVGGGLPGGYGPYADYMGLLVEQYGFYWVDLGLIGFYFVIGLIALLGLLGYSLKGVFLKLPPDGLYLNMYFAYLIIVSVTTMEIYRPGIFVVQAIGLYLIDIARDEYKELNYQSE